MRISLDIHALLKAHFGYDSFRGRQEAVIQHVLTGGDALLVMPDGEDKSLCYQLPALVLDGVTLVVSPRDSWVNRQIHELNNRGIGARHISRALSAREVEQVQAEVQRGDVRILYVAPDQVTVKGLRQFLRGIAGDVYRKFLTDLPVSLIAIDEAHRISELSRSFQTDYVNLMQLREMFPNTPVLALTTGATEGVSRDVSTQLRLRDALVAAAHKDLLKQRFGLHEFRPPQEEVILHVLSGGDALLLMQTGGGKSLCYELPALALDGVTLVVSPLIALMKDQVDILKGRDIPARFINHLLSAREIAKVQAEVRQGQVKLLYAAPERLALPDFQRFLSGVNVSLIAIDEAHCISVWGHDFRPDYRNLRPLREMFPSAPVLALTATATERVRRDIIAQLGLQDGQRFVTSFNRPNLTYEVLPKANLYHSFYQQLQELLTRWPGHPVIIYCPTRKNTEEVAEELGARGWQARAYHAGMDSDERRQTQDDFIEDRVPIVAATIAFGMGIDKPDVRMVVHTSVPGSVEGYYQETGRAGRDGHPSDCVLLYSYEDRARQKYFIERNFKLSGDEAEYRNAQDRLEKMIRYARSRTCRRRYLLEYFSERWEAENCGGCDVCLRSGGEPSPSVTIIPRLPRSQGQPVLSIPATSPTPQRSPAATATPNEFDATEIAKKMLSAVVRTGERYGETYVIRVLLGSRDKRILAAGHDNLSVYGIVKDYDRVQLREVIRLLRAKELLALNEGEYPTLRVTDEGRAFLQSSEQIWLPRLQTERKAQPTRQPPAPQTSEGRAKGVGRRPSNQTVVRDLLAQGLSVEGVAERMGLKPTTIIGHVERLVEQEETVDIGHLAPSPERMGQIEEAMAVCGSAFLRPVWEYLGAEFTYDELRMARVWIRQQGRLPKG